MQRTEKAFETYQADIRAVDQPARASPMARAIHANTILNELAILTRHAGEVRRKAIADAVAGGLSYAEIAAELDISKSMVARLNQEHAARVHFGVTFRDGTGRSKVRHFIDETEAREFAVGQPNSEVFKVDTPTDTRVGAGSIADLPPSR